MTQTTIRIIDVGRKSRGGACRCPQSVCVQMPAGRSPNYGRLESLELLTPDEIGDVERAILSGTAVMHTEVPDDCPMVAAGLREPGPLVLTP